MGYRSIESFVAIYHNDVSAKAVIKRMLIKNPDLTVHELQTRLDHRGVKISSFAVSGIRANFIADLRFLQNEGVLKNIRLRERGLIERPRRKLRMWWKRPKKKFKPWWFNG